MYIQHDNESKKFIFNLGYIHVNLSTDGMILFMCPCILFASYSMLPHWLVVCAYILCISCKCIWIFMSAFIKQMCLYTSSILFSMSIWLVCCWSGAFFCGDVGIIGGIVCGPSVYVACLPCFIRYEPHTYD